MDKFCTIRYMEVGYNEIIYVQRARNSPMLSQIRVGYEGTKSKSWCFLGPHFPVLIQAQRPPRLPSHHPKPSSAALSLPWS